MSMEKAIGSVFGAGASATKMLTAGVILTPEELKYRLILAAVVAIPGAIVGYIVTVLMKYCHRKVKSRFDRRDSQKQFIKEQMSKNQKTRGIRIFLILFFFALATFAVLSRVQLNHMQANLSFLHRSNIPKSQIRVAVVAGHGSIIKDKYQTQGKQSPEWPNGTKIYEGYSTHMLANDLVSELQYNDIEADLLTWNATDISLYQRAFMSNSLYRQDDRIIVVSLHHNAQPYNSTSDYTDKEGFYGWLENGANGTEVFTSPGQTRSDEIAEYVIQEIRTTFPEMKMRTDLTDGDQDKEAGFYLLTKTKSPAVLIEWGFMTNYKDCQMITNRDDRRKFIQAVTQGIVRYNQSLIPESELIDNPLNIAA